MSVPMSVCSAIKGTFGGNPHVNCNRQGPGELTGVVLCFDKTFAPIDCDPHEHSSCGFHFLFPSVADIGSNDDDWN